ncbi:hypothetical protein ACFVZW_26210 [Streptomyces sp. NPDC059567]|uniref:hypothetical protein n=1 Tax=Streptomyces sp. NPDC059567 TaxID=3346867 RepID=UPI00369FE399
MGWASIADQERSSRASRNPSVPKRGAVDAVPGHREELAVHPVQVALQVHRGGDPPVVVQRLGGRGAPGRVPVHPDPPQVERAAEGARQGFEPVEDEADVGETGVDHGAELLRVGARDRPFAVGPEPRAGSAP